MIFYFSVSQKLEMHVQRHFLEVELPKNDAGFAHTNLLDWSELFFCQSSDI